MKLHDQPSLAGQTAIVTGGASGIGRATCLSLARLGAAVVVVDRHQQIAGRNRPGTKKFGRRTGVPS